MKKNRTVTIYKHIRNSMDRQVSRIKISRNSYRVAIEELTRGVHIKRGSTDKEDIEHIETSSMDRDCDNSYREKKLKRLDR